MSKWHKPTEQENLNEAHEYFKIPKKKRKRLDWWDKVKIAIYEDKAKTDFEIIEQKKLPPSKP